jgi:chaperone BCS1
MTGGLESVADALRSQIGSGVLALSLAGAMVAAGVGLARAVPKRLWDLLQRQFIVSVDVLSGDPTYDALRLYLDRHPYSRKARKLSAAAASEMRSGPRSEREADTSVTFTPAPGNHLLWIKGRPVWLSRERKENETTGRLTETLNVRMFGRSQEAARQIFTDAMALIRRESGVGMYVASYGDWRRLLTKTPRSLESVVLRAGQQERLCGVIAEFLASEQWYAERGITWSLGCFFWGVPGGGKTSEVEALAGHFGVDLYQMPLGPGIANSTLTNMLLNVPAPAFVLLEDVHTLVKDRELKHEDKDGVSFAGLLNALGGIATRPGIVYIANSNLPPESFPPEFVRDGRFDIKEQFPVCDADQATRAFRIFYPGASPETATAFGSTCAGQPMSTVQRYMMQAKTAPMDALAVARGSGAGVGPGTNGKRPAAVPVPR